MTSMEGAQIVREFLADGNWRPREAIIKGTHLVDHELNEAMKLLFEIQCAQVVRAKHQGFLVYRIPPPSLDMFGNPV
jgi:hypothetical protein